MIPFKTLKKGQVNMDLMKADVTWLVSMLVGLVTSEEWLTLAKREGSFILSFSKPPSHLRWDIHIIDNRGEVLIALWSHSERLYKCTNRGGGPYRHEFREGNHHAFSLAHDQLETFFAWMQRAFPQLEERLQPWQAAALRTDLS